MTGREELGGIESRTYCRKKVDNWLLQDSSAALGHLFGPLVSSIQTKLLQFEGDYLRLVDAEMLGSEEMNDKLTTG